MTCRPSLPTSAYPGLPLGSASIYTAGPGVHIHDGQIVASLLGTPTILSPAEHPKTSNSKPIITIPRLLPSPVYGTTSSAHVSNTNVLPAVGSLVLARVLRVRQRQVDLGILCVSLAPTNPVPAVHDSHTDNDDDYYYDNSRFHVCSDAYPATIRREDIRATEKDKIVCSEMFRPGDVVKGEVISLGDSANYYVHTGRNELGVVMARSERTGGTMAPVSWKEFEEIRDEGEGLGRRIREGRKVAKPF
ncbi:uncharacterized protein KY384_004906 [Bacidia gigantensis]|uniref:uncharacterized protein n=1 Tax=Bacidia gigantensis TaxID=2732470 RepID=UPI001D04F5F3|nr:uncharacterized protein KY384_004906 [Bacidia gigantensis]KAG8530404.1 hypothetical protein KY384_004906 [Bacidia gigantensis]